VGIGRLRLSAIMDQYFECIGRATNPFTVSLLSFNSKLQTADCKLIPTLLQVYHKYKVLATKFLQIRRVFNCIKNVHRVYHKRTAS
jgi:hypothetical protein